MDVLIIGGTGVISTGITQQIGATGHDTTCLTRGETDADVPEDIDFIQGDRNNRADLDRAAMEVEPDCVIDMVCFEPDQAEAAIDVFEGRITQYIFCSTVDVYHRPPASNPVQEGASREPPVSDYGENKAECEDLFMAAHEDRKFKTTIIRPWSTYGEGGTVFHTFGQGTYYLDRIRQGKPIVVHGDGTSIWGSCHRDDVGLAFVNAVGNDTAYGEAYHVTSEEIITWNQYYRRVARAMDAPEPELIHIPTEQLWKVLPERTEMLEAHFQYSTVFDNSKAKRDLDFKYTIPFEEGIRRTIDRLEAEDAIDPWDTENDDAVIEAWRDMTGSFGTAIDERSE